MLRIIKKYKIPFKKVPKGETVPGTEMSFRCCKQVSNQQKRDIAYF